MKLLQEIHSNLTENEHQAKIQALRDKGLDVQEMPNGKLKIEDPQGRIEDGDWMIYDEPERAVSIALSMVDSWLD